MASAETDEMEPRLLCRVAHKAEHEYISSTQDLHQLTPVPRSDRVRCRACVDRDERLQANARYLLAELATTPARPGAGRHSWQRAIWLTSGWPPPAASAAEPEPR